MKQYLKKLLQFFTLIILFIFPSVVFSQTGRGNTEYLKRLRAANILKKTIPAKPALTNRAGAVNNFGTFSVAQADSLTNPLQNIIQSLVGPGVEVSNITTNLPATSNIYGTFSGAYDIIGIDQGLLLTSGSVFNALGPNISAWTSQDNGLPGYTPMDPNGFDAAIISFDVKSTSNFLTFKYVFASEEYNEYVGSVFNDQFGFFITGPGFPTATNIALIPGTSTNVAINNVNLGLNPLHYIDNETDTTSNPLRFQTLEYDGLTKVFTTAAITVEPGQPYRLTIVIQDVSDGIYDSGVFIQGGSISSDSCVLSLQAEINNITCHGAHDGSIEVDYNGATGNVALLWSTGDTIREIEHLGPGTYTVTATDERGCHATLAHPVVLTDPAPLVVQPQVTGTACTGGTTGTVTLNVTGGMSPYTYKVDTVTNTTGFFDLLDAGSHAYRVTDAYHCNSLGTFVIPTTVNLSISPQNGISVAGVEQCFDVLVTDGTSNPLAGVPVDMTAGPFNNEITTVISDSAGVAHFCYTGTVSGTDDITAVSCAAQASTQFTWTQADMPLAFAVTGGGTYCSNATIQGMEIGLSGSQNNTSYQLRFDSANGSANIGLPVYGTGTAISFGYVLAHTATGSFSVVATNLSSLQSASMLNSVIVRKVPAANPARPAKIFGTTDACPYMGEGQVTYYIRQVSGATSYEWMFKNGSHAGIIGSTQDTSITVSYDDGFIKDTLMVRSVNECSASPVYSAYTSLIISRLLPATPGAISGPANPCPYAGGDSLAVYSILPAANAHEYVWKVPAGASIIGSSSDPVFNTPVTDSLVTEDLSIYVSWQSMAGTATMYVSVTALNNCSRSATRNKSIKFLLPNTPGVITSSPPGSNVCPVVGTANTVTYSIRKVNNAIGYSWKVPEGAEIVAHGSDILTMPVSAPDSLVTPDTTIEVRYLASPPVGSYIRVSAYNDCWQSANRAFAVKASLPAAPSAISGLLNVCAKIVLPAPDDTIRYAVATPYLTGATSYSWTVSNPSAMQIVDAGADSTWIAVRFVFGQFVSGQVSVRSVSGCGISPTARTITVTTTSLPAPSAIAGLSNVCSKIGQSSPLDTARYTAASVAGAVGYRWTLTATAGHAAIVDAAPDSSWVAVQYSFGFSGGSISVSSLSGCGVMSATAKTLALVVTKLGTPVSISGPADLCPYIGTSVNATFTASAVSGATAYNWTVPAGATIVSGAGTRIINVRFDSYTSGDSISVQASNACTTGGRRTLQLTSSCGMNQFARGFQSNETSDQPGVNVYPNPNNGTFTVTIKTKQRSGQVIIKMTDMYGKVMSMRELPVINGQATARITSGNATPGMYLLVYIAGSETGSAGFMIVR